MKVLSDNYIITWKKIPAQKLDKIFSRYKLDFFHKMTKKIVQYIRDATNTMV